jgi:hypothetical protein
LRLTEVAGEIYYRYPRPENLKNLGTMEKLQNAEEVKYTLPRDKLEDQGRGKTDHGQATIPVFGESSESKFRVFVVHG